MPIYEYECTNCGFIKEVFHKMAESPEVQCPECSNHMKKLISPSAFHLKGSGWYVTDYKNKNSNNNSNKKETAKTETCSNKCSNAETCSAKKAANG